MAFQILPWAIAALAAGTAANAKARHDQRSAAKSAYRDWARRADGRSREATGVWERSLGEQDVDNQLDAVGDIAQQKLDRMGELEKSEGQYYDPILAGQSRAPTIVKSEIARQLGDELAKARAQIRAQATLEGYSGRTFDRGLQIARDNADMSNLGLFAQGDRNIYDSDMLKAQQAGETWATVGDILTAVGQAGLLAYGGGLTSLGGKAVAGGASLPAANGLGSLPRITGFL